MHHFETFNDVLMAVPLQTHIVRIKDVSHGHSGIGLGGVLNCNKKHSIT